MAKTTLLQLRMAEEEKALLSKVADDWGMSMASVIVKAIIGASAKTHEQFMAEYKEGLKNLTQE